MNVRDYLSAVRKKDISIEEQTARIISEAEKTNKKYNYFLTIEKEKALERARAQDKQLKKSRPEELGRLYGLAVSVKDCIVVKGIENKAGSHILKGYSPPYNSTAIKRIEAEGAIIIGKTVQDEFGFGSFTTNTGIGIEPPKNALDPERVCGGSSGGAAGFTALTANPHIALAESTGGSIACPASFNGVVGICPSYGRVSRYGLMDYANSLDKIGCMSKNVYDSALMLEIISGKDELDSTSLDKPVPKYSEAEKKPLRIGIIKELSGKGIDSGVLKCFDKSIKDLEELGYKTEEVSLPLNAKHGINAYYLIALSEASTNLAKYCGMRYGLEEKMEGHFNEYFSKIRSQGFGKEAKRRIMLGTFARMAGYRDAFYLKALQVRTLLIREYVKAFSEYDLLASPTMPIIAPTFKEKEKLSLLQEYLLDLCTAPANLCGLPHLTMNSGLHKDMPVGLMLTAPILEEERLLGVGEAYEKHRQK